MGMSNLYGWEGHKYLQRILVIPQFSLYSAFNFSIWFGRLFFMACQEGKDVVANPYMPADLK